jgi:signal transduction histidine kinase
VVLGVVACLSLWVRRRHPLSVALFAVPASTISALAGGATIVAVFNAALRASPRALAAITALSISSAAIFPLLYPSVGDYWEEVIFSELVIVVVIGWGLFTRARRALIASLHERTEQLESEQRIRVAQARDSERRRIAREMHDVLAHRLSLLSVHAGALEFHRGASAEDAANAAGVIRMSAQSALDELREIIGVLREDANESGIRPPQPTLARISALIDESRAAGMTIHCRSEISGGEGIPDLLGRTAYRIVQEGLTNARKHAPAATVDVTLNAGPPLVVEVISRPAGHSPSRSLPGGTGTGLIGLEERVELAAGELNHGPDGHGNFVLRATLPWTPG